MKTLRRLYLLLSIILLFGTGAAAKCPTGTVTVRGQVTNLPPEATASELTVMLETPKGPFSKSASIPNREYTVEVPFPTHSSSFMGTDSCHNLPTVVEVSVASGEKVYVRKKLQFKGNFEMYSPFEYRSKENLSIDVLKETGR
jgi:hypothetical protein